MQNPVSRTRAAIINPIKLLPPEASRDYISRDYSCRVYGKNNHQETKLSKFVVSWSS